MPKKRPHNKSKFGCDQCRKRRVKCDEQPPRCNNCTERGDECIFSRQKEEQLDQHKNPDLLEPTSISSSNPSTSMYPSRSSPHTLTLPASHHPPIALTEAALMHYWCTQTCRSFTRHGTEIFRSYVGQEALRHNYLLTSIYSVTLLHLSSALSDPASIRPLVKTALQYQNQSLAGLRANLNNMTPGNCDAMFACSVLVMVSAVVSPLLPVVQGTVQGEEATTAETVVILRGFMNGVFGVLEVTREWIEEGPLRKFFDVVEFTASEKDVAGEWPPVTALRRLMESEVDCKNTTPKQRAFSNAMDALGKVANREICAVFWILRVDGVFIDEVKKGDRFAMAVFMHWGVLLTVDDMWWKQYSGTRLVQELSALLVRYGGEWERMARWCRWEVRLYE